ncbi:MAG: aldehyde dehydrogenase family protein, partial [bacterium]|nr:aldehyde dehydrogenase family protein [bacterium]
MPDIKLPIIVCGKKIYPDSLSKEDLTRFSYETGESIVIPKLQEEHIKQILESDNKTLHDLSIDDIAKYLDKLSTAWSEKKEFAETTIKQISSITGYCERIIKNDFDMIIGSCDRSEIYEMIQGDLVNPYYLDEWLPSQAVYKHAQPRGSVLHIMVGNVPMASLFSLVRSIVTKNISICKLPKRDPVSIIAFASMLVDIDPENPIAKSISVAYWDPASDSGKRIIEKSNTICVWGKLSTMEAMRKIVPYGKELIEFGPKRSFAIYDDNGDIEGAALRLAKDISIYDQEACFCPLQVFVKSKDIKTYIKELQYYLDQASRLLPKIYTPIDVAAHTTCVIKENQFLGNPLIQGENQNWLIIQKERVEPLDEHPLNRTIFVYQIEDLDEISVLIDKDVQTVSIYPWESYSAIAEKFTFLGATRIVETGMAGHPRGGFSHDG